MYTALFSINQSIKIYIVPLQDTFSLGLSHWKQSFLIGVNFKKRYINAIQYNTIQYNTIQYNTIQHNTIVMYQQTLIGDHRISYRLNFGSLSNKSHPGLSG